MSLYSGIFPTAIGNTKSFNDAASFLGLVGILVGVGHILAGLSFMLVSNWMSKANKTLLLLFFFTIQLFGVVLILINIPKNANQSETYAAPLLLSSPNKALALIAAVLLGFSDAGINNIIYTTIPLIWKDNTLPAFSLFKDRPVILISRHELVTSLPFGLTDLNNSSEFLQGKKFLFSTCTF